MSTTAQLPPSRRRSAPAGKGNSAQPKITPLWLRKRTPEAPIRRRPSLTEAVSMSPSVPAAAPVEDLDELDAREGKAPPERFSRVVVGVTVAHVAVLIIVSLWAWLAPAPKPPLEMVSLLNPGDFVKGSEGASTATKIGLIEPVVPAGSKAKTAPEPVHPKPAAKPEAKAAPKPPEPVKHVEAPKPPPPKLVEAVKPVETPKPVEAPKPSDFQLPEAKPKVEKPKAEAKPVEKPVVEKPVPPKPVEKPKPEPAKPVAESKPLKPKIKVSLDEVVRPAPKTEVAKLEPKPKKKQAPADEPNDDADAPSAEAIARQLGDVHKNGAKTGKNSTAPSGALNGQGSGREGAFYTLIRNQMLDAWNKPLALAGQGLVTQVEITVDRDGSITGVRLVRGSGNAQHDASAMAAAHEVKKIHDTLPDGMKPTITVSFRIDE